MADHIAKADLRLLDDELARLDLRKIENVGYNAEQTPRIRLNRLGETALIRIERGLQQQISHADDAGQRSENLMAHVGQEKAFGFADRFGALLRLAQFFFGALQPGDFAFEVARLPAALRARHWLFGLGHFVIQGESPRSFFAGSDQRRPAAISAL
ncbi:MAG: hypothetical protein BWZ10_00175 [candidate division BRC1 bacterium ADurb.BinA364]|nr:MAG: hypothetical protein BWZ10_00175 [candidate division BRC1 bacterium ADurb.BinA364]